METPEIPFNSWHLQEAMNLIIMGAGSEDFRALLGRVESGELTGYQLQQILSAINYLKKYGDTRPQDLL